MRCFQLNFPKTLWWTVVTFNFNCQLDIIWNRLGSLSEKLFRLVWPVNTSTKGFLGWVFWRGKPILNESIIMARAGPWTVSERRIWAGCKHAFLLCVQLWMHSDPVAQAPATTMMDCNLELWDEPFLPIVSFVREFYHSNITVNIIVLF